MLGGYSDHGISITLCRDVSGELRPLAARPHLTNFRVSATLTVTCTSAGVRPRLLAAKISSRSLMIA